MDSIAAKRYNPAQQKKLTVEAHTSSQQSLGIV